MIADHMTDNEKSAAVVVPLDCRVGGDLFQKKLEEFRVWFGLKDKTGVVKIIMRNADLSYRQGWAD